MTNFASPAGTLAALPATILYGASTASVPHPITSARTSVVGKTIAAPALSVGATTGAVSHKTTVANTAAPGTLYATPLSFSPGVRATTGHVDASASTSATAVLFETKVTTGSVGASDGIQGWNGDANGRYYLHFDNVADGTTLSTALTTAQIGNPLSIVTTTGGTVTAASSAAVQGANGAQITNSSGAAGSYFQLGVSLNRGVRRGVSFYWTTSAYPNGTGNHGIFTDGVPLWLTPAGKLSINGVISANSIPLNTLLYVQYAYSAATNTGPSGAAYSTSRVEVFVYRVDTGAAVVAYEGRISTTAALSASTTFGRIGAALGNTASITDSFDQIFVDNASATPGVFPGYTPATIIAAQGDVNAAGQLTAAASSSEVRTTTGHVDAAGQIVGVPASPTGHIGTNAQVVGLTAAPTGQVDAAVGLAATASVTEGMTGDVTADAQLAASTATAGHADANSSLIGAVGVAGGHVDAAAALSATAITQLTTTGIVRASGQLVGAASKEVSTTASVNVVAFVWTSQVSSFEGTAGTDRVDVGLTADAEYGGPILETTGSMGVDLGTTADSELGPVVETTGELNVRVRFHQGAQQLFIDPVTQQPVPITIDPVTRIPMSTDPVTGQPVPMNIQPLIDPATGLPVPITIDPVTGIPMSIDPVTHQPVEMHILLNPGQIDTSIVTTNYSDLSVESIGVQGLNPLQTGDFVLDVNQAAVDGAAGGATVPVSHPRIPAPDLPIATGVNIRIVSPSPQFRLIDIVPNATSVSALEELKGDGAGSFRLAAGDSRLSLSPDIANYMNVCQVIVDGAIRQSWVLRNVHREFVGSGENAALYYEFSGPGLREWLKHAVVYPQGVANWAIDKLKPGTRYFNFSSPMGAWYNPAQWSTPIKIIAQGDTTPWSTGSSTGSPWQTAPVGWPDTTGASPYWIWSSDTRPTAPEGDVYFRYEFNTTDTDFWTYTLFVTADNAFQAYIDGEPVAAQNLKDTWHFLYQGTKDLGPGNHVIAIRASNSNGTSPAGMIAAFFKNGDAKKNIAAQLITVTGDPGWVCMPYPDRPPGFTAGEVLTILLNEAKIRGVTSLQGVDIAFTNATDSNGEAWAEPIDFAFDIGMTYYDVVARLEELACEVRINPITFKLEAYNKQGTHRDTGNSPVEFRRGHNVLQASEESQGDFTNVYLMSYGDEKLTEVKDTYHSIPQVGRIESFYSTDTSRDKKTTIQIANKMLELGKDPNDSATIVITDVQGHAPWKDFKVGDWVLGPGTQGLRQRRVVSIATTQDEKTGRAAYEVELDTKSQDRADKIAEFLQRMPAFQSMGEQVQGSNGADGSNGSNGGDGSNGGNGSDGGTGGTGGDGSNGSNGQDGYVTIYVQPDEPADYTIGTLWYDTDASS